MKIVICNSKNWFNLDANNESSFSINIIKHKKDLTKDFLDSISPDYIFFVHWSFIVPSEIYSNFECIVFHTAPLPYGRGGTPIQNLILEGFKTAPLCALRMIGELDSGPIYEKREISLDGSLSDIFSRLNYAINILIRNISRGNIVPSEQVGKPHVFKKLTKESNELPSNISLLQLYDRIRMLDHEDYPNPFLISGDLKFEFFNAELDDDAITVKCRISKC
tara:strand:+ start:3799 stop:4461 length:663 start_codon:yes stop_codon:yes gene_type:complete